MKTIGSGGLEVSETIIHFKAKELIDPIFAKFKCSQISKYCKIVKIQPRENTNKVLYNMYIALLRKKGGDICDLGDVQI